MATETELKPPEQIRVHSSVLFQLDEDGEPFTAEYISTEEEDGTGFVVEYVRADHAPQLKWTKERPATDGYYWFRWRGQLTLFSYAVNKLWGFLSADEQHPPSDGEFLGPITPHSEVEKLKAERDKLLEVLETRAARELEMLEGVARENDVMREALEVNSRILHNETDHGAEKITFEICQQSPCVYARAALAPEGKE